MTPWLATDGSTVTSPPLQCGIGGASGRFMEKVYYVCPGFGATTSSLTN